MSTSTAAHALTDACVSSHALLKQRRLQYRFVAITITTLMMMIVFNGDDRVLIVAGVIATQARTYTDDLYRWPLEATDAGGEQMGSKQRQRYLLALVRFLAGPMVVVTSVEAGSCRQKQRRRLFSWPMNADRGTRARC